jgi:2-methylcitrate dehydratase PrpD
MDVLTKSHAAAARVAAGIDGMLALRLEHGFGADDIASIALGIPRIIQGRLTNKHPVDLQAAQMSLPFSVAVAAKVPLSGHVPDLTVIDFEAGLSDSTLHGLEERTAIALDEEVEAASNDLSTAARVSVTLSDGRTLSMLVPAPKGSPAKPFTDEEQEERFTRELSTRILPKSCAEIIAMARDLDRLDPTRLCGLLTGG